jgi:uncharacterized membrane protein YdfJ with MMPL/SSD domain
VRALGHYSFLYRRAIVAAALVCAAAAAIYGSSVFDRTKPFGFSDPESESSRGYELLERVTGEKAVPGVLLLVQATPRVESPRGAALIRRATRDLAGIDGISHVVEPRPGGPQISADGQVALIQGYIDDSVDDIADVGERVVSTFEGRRDVLAGGPAVASVQLNRTTEDEVRRIELYAAPFLLLISLLVFRSLVAAALPLFVGGLSIAFALAGLRALSEVMEVDIFALNVVTVLGLGLAIDYSLFMVSRYRRELARSGRVGEALRRTMPPVGRMVLFSALTVAAAVASLAVFPQRFLYSTGVGCALIAVLSAAVVLLVLPAVLACLGEKVNALAISDLRRPIAPSRPWGRVAGLVLAHPAIVTVAVATVMALLAVPFLRVELTRADARVLPRDDSAHVVDKAIRTRFREDPSATILIVTPTGSPSQPGAGPLRTKDLITRIEKPRVLNDTTALVTVHTRGNPYSGAALDLVRSIRSDQRGLVTGTSAELVDQRSSLRDHLPLAIAIVLASTMIALALMTRSVILPVLSLIVNTLTIGVAFGVLVLVFQDQRLEGVLVYTGVGALDISVPILLFAVIFGLSTDYGVFLLSSIAEQRANGRSDKAAIDAGLKQTGRIITAAALLFAVVMGSFAFSQMIFIKEVAVGTTVAVLVDATLVRGLLLPAMMRLCGRWTWWAPPPLRRPSALRA